MHHYFNACLSTALYITQQCIQIIIIVTVHPSLLQCLLVHSIIYYTAVHTNNYNCYSASLLQCLLVHSIIYYTAVHTNNYNCYSASLLQCLLVHSIIYYTAVHTNNYNCYSASFITSMFACPQYYILHSSAYK